MDDARADEILALYTRLSELTSCMRLAARASDWDELIALESECASVSSLLVACEDGAPRTMEYRRRKADLIRKVLDNDAEIRQSVNKRLTGLWQLVDGRTNIEKLNAAYGGKGTSPRTAGL